MWERTKGKTKGFVPQIPGCWRGVGVEAKRFICWYMRDLVRELTADADEGVVRVKGFLPGI